VLHKRAQLRSKPNLNWFAAKGGQANPPLATKDDTLVIGPQFHRDRVVVDPSIIENERGCGVMRVPIAAVKTPGLLVVTAETITGMVGDTLNWPAGRSARSLPKFATEENEHSSAAAQAAVEPK